MTFFDAMRAAVAEDDLDEAVATIQRSVGITDGGYASMVFSDMEDDEWENMERRERLHKLWDYAKGEMLWGADW